MPTSGPGERLLNRAPNGREAGENGAQHPRLPRPKQPHNERGQAELTGRVDTRENEAIVIKRALIQEAGDGRLGPEENVQVVGPGPRDVPVELFRRKRLERRQLPLARDTLVVGEVVVVPAHDQPQTVIFSSGAS